MSGAEADRRVAAHDPDTKAPFSEAKNAGKCRVCQVAQDVGAHCESRGQCAVEGPITITGLSAYPLVRTQDKLDEFIDSELRRAGVVAVDLETVGLNPATLKVRIISLMTEEGTWLVDCLEVDPASGLLALTGKTLVFHNALFDLYLFPSVAEGCSTDLDKLIPLPVVARRFCVHPLGEHIKERQVGAPEVIWATSQEVSDRSPRSEP
jgi:hypothetical protein